MLASVLLDVPTGLSYVYSKRAASRQTPQATPHAEVCLINIGTHIAKY